MGGILGVANLAPARVGAALVHTRYMTGDRAGAGALQERIGPLHNAVVGGMGVAGVKRGLDLLGFHGGVPRPPLRPTGAEVAGAANWRKRWPGPVSSPAPRAGAGP